RDALRHIHPQMVTTERDPPRDSRVAMKSQCVKPLSCGGRGSCRAENSATDFKAAFTFCAG
ncbi:MAG: hypothetical protein QXQ53_09130, partial [Candidatus Methanosuratincola sp.]